MWQQTYRSAAMRTAPWVLATNEAGETVIDQTWPAGVNETLALLKRVSAVRSTGMYHRPIPKWL